jgi:acetyltransferase-like isoleucine patch superfamily enzyme
MRPVIFLGTSTNLEVPLRICQLRNIPVAGIVDSDYYGNTDKKNDVQIIGSEHSFDFDASRDQFDFFVGQSYSTQDQRSRKKRLDYISIINRYNLNCATLIHPGSEIYDGVKIGPGCLIGFCAGISHHVTIGAHSRLDSFSIIGHHVEIGDNCYINSYSMISTNTIIKDNVSIMPGAAILRTGKNHTVVGNDAIIYPRVTVARDVEPGEIVSLAGNNTRRIYGEVIRS